MQTQAQRSKAICPKSRSLVNEELGFSLRDLATDLHLNQDSVLPFSVSSSFRFVTRSHISVILNWDYNNLFSEIRELAKLWLMEGFSNFRISGDLEI